ncbi:hypothetical protein H696_01994 [Fonticula alba]|uniref:Uncharacterized protein n=1 Tax=Fonticula alba TaxID=691883 RepID=A0A058Z9Z1_FONAL|nr:hypothetical protein H696_01994 [Fonticula alba]KCV71045.1 hypothetical protein H696_01994 [Fonticula alba]|eukprot:XP_009494168.1 hypothetical protein H696_01994 [Fonticula alba]
MFLVGSVIILGNWKPIYSQPRSEQSSFLERAAFPNLKAISHRTNPPSTGAFAGPSPKIGTAHPASDSLRRLDALIPRTFLPTPAGQHGELLSDDEGPENASTSLPGSLHVSEL